MKNLPLPQYPVRSDLWDRLKNEKRPIVIYGMGNGADKLICKFRQYGISFADIFASDGFVRGHSFHGIRVKSFTEIKGKYQDFVIVLSFASSRPEVIEMISKMNDEYSLVVPDMPVAQNVYFDKDFYNLNYERIKSVYDKFEDALSKFIYSSCIWYKLTGELSYLLNAYSEKEEIYRLIGEGVTVMADAGAYNGDTVKEAIEHFGGLKRIYAFEPDKKNFKKLERFKSEYEGDIEILIENSGVWCENTNGSFSESGNRNSSINATASYKTRENSVSLTRLDTFINEKVDYIKFDVEGAEAEALIGTEGIIAKDFPTMLISAYHKSEDLFSLAEYIIENFSEYKIYLRRTLCFPAWEICLIVKK